MRKVIRINEVKKADETRSLSPALDKMLNKTTDIMSDFEKEYRYLEKYLGQIEDMQFEGEEDQMMKLLEKLNDMLLDLTSEIDSLGNKVGN